MAVALREFNERVELTLVQTRETLRWITHPPPHRAPRSERSSRPTGRTEGGALGPLLGWLVATTRMVRKHALQTLRFRGALYGDDPAGPRTPFPPRVADGRSPGERAVDGALALMAALGDYLVRVRATDSTLSAHVALWGVFDDLTTVHDELASLLRAFDPQGLPSGEYWDHLRTCLVAVGGHANLLTFGVLGTSDLRELRDPTESVSDVVLDSYIALLNVHTGRQPDCHHLRFCDTKLYMFEGDLLDEHVRGGPTVTGLGPGLLTAIPVRYADANHWVLYVVDQHRDGAPLVCLLDSFALGVDTPSWLTNFLQALVPGWDGTIQRVDCPRQQNTKREKNGCSMHVLQNMEMLARRCLSGAATAGDVPWYDAWSKAFRLGRITTLMRDRRRLLSATLQALRDDVPLRDLRCTIEARYPPFLTLSDEDTRSLCQKRCEAGKGTPKRPA